MNRKNISRRSVDYLLLTIAMLLLLPQEAAAKFGYTRQQPLSVGVDVNYAPLEYVEADGTPRGYDVEFTRLLMSRLQLPFVYSPNTWRMVAHDLMGHRIGLAMMVYSDYRKDSINYSRPIFRFYYQMVTRKDDPKRLNFRNLKGKTIAYMPSRPIGKLMDREGANGVRVNDLDSAIQMLADGHFDGLICYRFQASYLIGKYDLDNLQAEELSLNPREYCYASHDKALISAINNEITKMEQEGIIDDIYGENVKTYFGKNVIPVWVWYLIATLIFVFLIIFILLRYKGERNLQRAYDMLETSHNILEMSNSELEQANRDLIEANARAEESSKMKSNFIQQISHEIRTPLNVLSGFTQVLTASGMELDEATKQDINMQIVENTNRITSLVNKMLELSDASSKAVINRNDDVPVSQIAAQAIDDSGITNAAHLNFSLQLSSEAETAMVHTNLRAATRALSLLLDNAQKFTHPAEAHHRHQAMEKKESVVLQVTTADDSVRFTVEDTGIGIPESEAEHIFDEFVQLDEYYDGTGIGLTVARSLARRLSGDIHLDTTYTDGARFVMTLPLK
ncbi:MAG: transporter substrate-binding domain-containing protein [Prevotella sp.]|nr:transporter substrate-binding domain-containing protein [Prevotella sp.]